MGSFLFFIFLFRNLSRRTGVKAPAVFPLLLFFFFFSDTQSEQNTEYVTSPGDRLLPFYLFYFLPSTQTNHFVCYFRSRSPETASLLRLGRHKITLLSTLSLIRYLAILNLYTHLVTFSITLRIYYLTVRIHIHFLYTCLILSLPFYRNEICNCL